MGRGLHWFQMYVMAGAFAVLAPCANAQTHVAGTTRSFDSICVSLISAGKDLGTQCVGTAHITVPTLEELKAGKRPSIRVPYGSGQAQVWELGKDVIIPNSRYVVFEVASVDGRPAQGRCQANQYDSFTVGLNCYTQMVGQDLATLHSVDLSYSAAKGGTAKGPARELLEHVAAIHLLQDPRSPVLTTIGPALAQPPAVNPTPAVASAPAPAPVKVSDDKRAIFGLLAGGPAPMTAPRCSSDLLAENPVPKGAPYCLDELTSGLGILFSELLGVTAEEYQSVGYRTASFAINRDLFDTRIADNVDLIIDRDGVIQNIVVRTFELDSRVILGVLQPKFGAPSASDETTWTNRSTGQAVARTPNFTWNARGMTIDYQSRIGDMLAGTATPLGKIEIQTVAYQRALQAIEARRKAAIPGKRAM